MQGKIAALRSPWDVAQACEDQLCQPLGLVEREAVTGVSNPFDSYARIDAAQLVCDVEPDDGTAIADDEQSRNVERTHDIAILGMGWREHVEGADAGLQSGFGLKLKEFHRATRTPLASLRDELTLRATEESAVLTSDVAGMHFALALGTQERRIDQNECAKQARRSASDDSGGHAAHRVTEEHRLYETEAIDKTHGVARVVRVPIAVLWRARASMAPSVGHDHIELAFEPASDGRPACAASDQAVQHDNRGFRAPCAPVVDVDVVGPADAVAPGRHGRTKTIVGWIDR